MKFLKYISVWLLLCISLWTESSAQEYIYFNTGSKTIGKLVSANEEKIGMLLEGTKSWNTGRDKVAVAFNQIGNYLVIEDLATDETQAVEQINTFYGEEKKGFVNDILLKAAPFEIIACTIQSEKDAVNYLTLEGKSASISKDDLLGIIRKDGSHQLESEAPEVFLNLRTNYAKIQQLRTLKKTPSITPKPAPPPPPVTPTQPLAEVVEPKSPQKLTPEEQKLYKAKSVDKVKELNRLLNQIVDKSRSQSEKNEAIREALKIFVPGSKMQVSSVKDPTQRTSRSVEDYLVRLSKLNYPKIEITMANLAVVEDFEADDKGNHWGIVTGEQIFDAGVFRDVTKKNYKIKLQPYKKAEKENERNYQILIGDVNVVVD